MSFSTIKTRILNQIKTLETLLEGYAIFWPNAPVDTDDNLITKYVVVTIIWGKTERADLGSGASSVRQRTIGILQIAIHGELYVGESDILEKADSVAALVRHATATPVHFRTPSVASRGRVNDGNHWRVDVEAPFYADVTS